MTDVILKPHFLKVQHIEGKIFKTMISMIYSKVEEEELKKRSPSFAAGLLKTLLAPVIYCMTGSN